MDLKLAILSAALLLSTLPAAAQPCSPGELRVFVTDSQETPVFNAAVQLAPLQTEALSPAPADHITETQGTVNFSRVPCGTWRITASKDGFEPAIRSVQIVSGKTVEITLTLKPKMQAASLDVTDTAPPIEQSSSQKSELKPAEVKFLPSNPATVSDALPLVPGVVRTPDGELKIDGTGEQRSALVVNQTDVTDPATGKFGQTIPIDAIESVNVLNTPFLAQYGRFTAGVVAVETRRGGEKWHADLNDPFPDFRIRSYHMRGIRNEGPHLVIGGPVVQQRLYLNTAFQYLFSSEPSRTLPFPFNESRQEVINSFTQVDFVASARQILTATLHWSPQHTNFVNPEYFNPQPVTPSYAQHNYIGTAADHFSIFGGIIDSSLSFQRFDAVIGAQGSADMILTPTGNRGNYFGAQNRGARRTEWLETFSPKPLRLLGNHLVKIGSSYTTSGDAGQFTYHPVDILDNAGILLQRIEFANRVPFSRSDLEITAYVQDHWMVAPGFAFDYGARVEHQDLAGSLRIAPRAGFAWTPWKNERTVFRAGYGQFYDHLPLDVYTFGRYPQRTITNYAPDGSIIGQPQDYVNVIGNVNGPRSFLVKGQPITGGFAPRGVTWNAQVEHSFSRLLKMRVLYTDNRSVGLLVFSPESQGPNSNNLVLNGDGASRYRHAEVTARFAWKDGQQMVLAYTRSRAEGNLNNFDTFLGNFPNPLIRPVVYSNLPADLPNRFLTWGHVKIPFERFEIYPVVEYRNGFPYARLDVHQNYVGVPNNDKSRFPNFFSADARLTRDFKVTSKYTIRLSVTGFNLTNHFNALAIHANTADPQYGIFFGNYKRRYRFDFDIIF